MKTVHTDQIRDAIARMFQLAAVEMTSDVQEALQSGAQNESGALAKKTLLRILENADVAKQRQMPMCQDTGLIVIFARVGQDVHITGGLLSEAINAGVRQGCQSGYLRASVTADPLERSNTQDNTPAIVHVELVEGDQLHLHLLAKGGGAESMSRFQMLTPAQGRQAVADFVVETAVQAGPNACPPMVIGVGIGGSFEYSAVLAKRSLLRLVGRASELPHVAELEREILDRINRSGVGPQGYGGDTTALAVHIETAACHIANLPVSVNIECHAHRHQAVVL